MAYVNWVKVAVVGVSILGLAACKSGYKPLPGGQGGANGNAGAQTYAFKGQHGYQGQVRRDQYGRIINPLVAPSNQTYYFAFDSSALRPSDLKAIRIQGNYLALHPKAIIRLEGNTDNRGSREYNIGLGWRRDQTVYNVLKLQGVRSRQIRMVSYGKERPAVIGNNERAWMLNRRVNLIYVNN